jgi:cation diffusion facilitator family transporter
MIISFFTNLFLSILKVVVGFIFTSSALVADGIHSFSDLLTDIVAIVGNIFSSKPADKEHPYGHGRLEYLTSIFVGFIVLVVGMSLIFEVSKNDVKIPSRIVILVSIFTIIAKYILANYLIKKGKKYDNQILISSGRESKADVYSSIIVLLSSILMQLEVYFHPFIYADKITSVIVGVFIVRTGYMILKENINIIIGKQEDKTDYYNDIKKLILQNKYIKNIDSLIVMKYGYHYSLTVEVSMDENLTLKKAHDEIEKIEEELKQNERTKYINIHMNPYKD